MTDYPREIILTHPRLIKLTEEKGQLIAEGREISKQIEELDLEMGKIDVRLQAEEAKVDVNDLKAQGEAIIKEMEVIAKQYGDRIKAVETSIFERMKANTDPKLKEQYESIKKQKEELENERNKRALKAQRTKDKLVRFLQKLLTPHLENEYEDLQGAELVDGVVKGYIFSHLDNWDKAFKAKKKKLKV